MFNNFLGCPYFWWDWGMSILDQLDLVLYHLLVLELVPIFLHFAAGWMDSLEQLERTLAQQNHPGSPKIRNSARASFLSKQLWFDSRLEIRATRSVWWDLMQITVSPIVSNSLIQGLNSSSEFIRLTERLFSFLIFHAKIKKRFSDFKFTRNEWFLDWITKFFDSF